MVYNYRMAAKIDTLIVSDIHLGSLVSRAKKLTELIEETDFKRLILLGDIFHDVRIDRLQKDHWDFLSSIKTISDDAARQVIWIRGNHDHALADNVSALFGVKWCDEYLWEFKGKRYLAIHGHRFVKVAVENKFVRRFTDPFYLFLQRIDKKNRHIVRLLNVAHSRGLMLPRQVALGAAEYARDLKVEYIFCGHTHKADEKVFFADKENDESVKVHYYNVGCWTTSPSTFAAVHGNGEVTLEEFS